MARDGQGSFKSLTQEIDTEWWGQSLRGDGWRVPGKWRIEISNWRNTLEKFCRTKEHNKWSNKWKGRGTISVAVINPTLGLVLLRSWGPFFPFEGPHPKGHQEIEENLPASLSSKQCNLLKDVGWVSFMMEEEERWCWKSQMTVQDQNTDQVTSDKSCDISKSWTFSASMGQ